MTGPFTALTQAFALIFNVSGRATRAEFWWVFLAFSLFGIAAVAADVISIKSLVRTSGEPALATLNPLTFYSTAVAAITFIPFTTLGIRRLHDAGFSGFWGLVGLVPGLGGLILLVMYALPTQNRTTIYGTPKVASTDAAGRPAAVDAQKRAMQGYAVLLEKDRPVTPEMANARKAEISEYYRSRVLKPAASV